MQKKLRYKRINFSFSRNYKSDIINSLINHAVVLDKHLGYQKIKAGIKFIRMEINRDDNRILSIKNISFGKVSPFYSIKYSIELFLERQRKYIDILEQINKNHVIGIKNEIF